MPRKVFTAGEVLAAADVNEFLMDQAIQSFAGTVARGSAIPSPVEGMAAYLNDSNIVSIYDGSAWKNSLSVTGGILQVVTATSTTAVNSTTDTYVSAGLAATITPKSASSIILINAGFSVRNAVTTAASVWTLFRGDVSTGTNLGTTSGSDPGFFQAYNASSEIRFNGVISTTDSPNTTSAVTYTIAFKAGNTGNASAMFEGRKGTITLMEVAV